MARPDFRTYRLFLDAELRASVEIALNRDQANYARNVLRLPAGAQVLVFNGRDGEWSAELRDTGRRTVSAVLQKQTRPQAATGRIAYAFAPLKHARLDYVVQKAVELGAAELMPLFTRHTQAARVNLERMRANVIEAAEQCGVLTIPPVHEPLSFERWLQARPAASTIVFCDEEAETADPVEALRQVPHGPVVLLVGPEGGFEESERKALLVHRSAVRLSLGPRILRADTAAVAALALLQAVIGDWR